MCEYYPHFHFIQLVEGYDIECQAARYVIATIVGNKSFEHGLQLIKVFEAGAKIEEHGDALFVNLRSCEVFNGLSDQFFVRYLKI